MCKYYSAEQIDPCHETISTSLKAGKKAEGNKLGESEEDKAKKDDLMASKQTLQCTAATQTNNLHQDLTLTDIKIPIFNTEKKVQNSTQTLHESSSERPSTDESNTLLHSELQGNRLISIEPNNYWAYSKNWEHFINRLLIKNKYTLLI